MADRRLAAPLAIAAHQLARIAYPALRQPTITRVQFDKRRGRQLALPTRTLGRPCLNTRVHIEDFERGATCKGLGGEGRGWEGLGTGGRDLLRASDG